MVKMNNKGYSLTELLLTLAIFGFVMLGIATIMRTTSVSYKDGDAQVTMQTEAQVIANQIEELLVDAQLYDALDEGYFSSGAYNGDKYITIRAKSGLTHYIVLDDEEKRLYYQQNGTGDGNWSLMAEYVTAIDIEGYSTTTTDANCDNMVTLNVTLDKQGYEYTAVKDVFFRNAVEDNTVMQIASLVSGGGSTSTIKVTAEIERYDVFDLQTECGLDTTKPFKICENGVDEDTLTSTTMKFDDYYEFVTVTYKSTGENKVTADAIEGIASTGSVATKTRYIRTIATVDKDFTANLGADKKVTLVGTSTTGSPIEVTLTTKAVAYNVNKTGKTSDGFLTVTSTAGDTERYNMIVVDGINLAGFLNPKLNTLTTREISFKMVAYKDSGATGDKVYQSSERVGYTPSLKTLTSAGGAGNKSQICGTPMMDVGLAVDNVTGDLAIHTDPFSASDVYAEGNYRIAVMIYVPNNVLSTADTVVLDFNVYQQGDSMAAYKGGNQYTGQFTDSGWN